MKVLIATEKPFAPAAVEGIKKVLCGAGHEVTVLEGYKDKSECIQRLHATALNIERNCSPEVDFDKAIEFERQHSKEWDGKTV